MILAIDGPIASGKSTLARAVARELRGRGRTAATIDLDLVYEMVADDPKDDPAMWELVRHAADALARALPVDVVVIDGEPLRADRVVTLMVPFEEALRRVAQDPSRSVSRNPAFLRRHYDEQRPPVDAVDTSTRDVRELARQIADDVV